MTDHDKKAAAQQALAERIAANGGHPNGSTWYIHYKGGVYIVLAVGIREDTLEPTVGYRSVRYKTDSFRTLDDWCSTVAVGGKDVPRFRPYDPARDGPLREDMGEVQP